VGAAAVSVEFGAIRWVPVAPEGQAAATLGVTAAVAGAPVRPGTAAASLGVTGSAAGLPEPLGQAAASLTVTASIAGTVLPSWGVPQNLQATAVSDDQIDLTWTAILAASGYDIERDGLVVASDHPTASYSDTGLDPDTLYTYRVRAVG
jgi:hypothetical protein